jgi:hypothetical protein
MLICSLNRPEKQTGRYVARRSASSRIFQQKTVPEILEEVLGDLDVAWEIQGEFEPRDYCVQYRESDFDFVSRLMEEEGIYYFFKHTEDGHQMIVADAAQSHLAVEGPESFTYEEIHGGARTDERGGTTRQRATPPWPRPGGLGPTTPPGSGSWRRTSSACGTAVPRGA